MSFNFMGEKKTKFFLDFSPPPPPTQKKERLSYDPCDHRPPERLFGEQARGQQHMGKKVNYLIKVPLFFHNFKLYRSLKLILSPWMSLLRRVNLFSARVSRMILQVPLKFQKTALKQRAKHTPQSSHGDQEVTQSSFPVLLLGLFDSRVRGFVSPVVSREGTRELKLQKF